MSKSSRRSLWLVTAGAISLVVVSALAAFTYAFWLSHTASDLIRAAYEIRTKADAERVIDDWRVRRGKNFWQESDQLGGDHVYDAVIDSVALARMHIAQPTGVTVGITMHNGKLWCVFVGEQTGWYPAASVAIQEWFDDAMPKRIGIFGNRRPYSAWLEFSAFIPEAQRKMAFSFNTKCMVSRVQCDREDKILPQISQLAAWRP
jgi:hypothetical protein